MDISSLAAIGHYLGPLLDPYNADINGDTLEGMFNRLDYEFKRSRLAIVMGGTNDVCAGISSMSMIRAFCERGFPR